MSIPAFFNTARKWRLLFYFWRPSGHLSE